ncbi:PREDICTED: transient receptor potential cation channel trpm isoform X3 [Nicrophorus vespilloides]|uniref:Transient receptor potential cation channel trpm isoform X3 n=1 Tax=Nicrophorus vespilloides TaxID=110193 RepID=A0ABM1MGL0_NICVS|nr:PREDICTED: transient receptor potential cation channel trpm isoform X3 [Nicrophorus vespilloides]
MISAKPKHILISSKDFQELNALDLLKKSKEKPPARTWIESNFQKRECTTFIQCPIDEQRCSCGRPSTYHGIATLDVPNSETWLPSRHTRATATDAFGTLDFQGGAYSTKAQYVRLAHDTRPERLLQLFTREWNLEPPKLLITVQGGKANFELQPKLKKVLRSGLLKAANTTGAWIFTSGTNTGVTRQVGDALLTERSQRSGKIISLGIAPWGIIENNHELLGINRDVQYHSISSPRSRLAVLNNRHSYFLLVDNGTQGKYGAEIVLRRKLEKFISMQKLHPYTYSTTPVVCLVIEGGTNTIRAVLEYVTDDPPVPVVVCDGSGRAADLIAFMHKYASDSDDIIENMKDYILTLIQRSFEVDLNKAECLYGELLQCTKRKNLITVFRISEHLDSRSQELDQTILTALFKAQHLTPSEQLSLALTWNRVDIARSEIFVYGQEWPEGALEEAMMQALEHDRIDFVKLLLEKGVGMKEFLTIPRLEMLYNTKQGPSNTLWYILKDLKAIPEGYNYTLHDIGLVINKLMGGAYRAYYTRRKFRPIYAKVMNKKPNNRHSSSFVKYCGNAMSLLAETLPTKDGLCSFEFPYNELFIWAVLTKRQCMALLMWSRGEEVLAKSLVACKLYKAMAHEASVDMETEVYEELRGYGKEFETIALDLLDYCYRKDDDLAQQLLTCELRNWSGQTCLSLAVAANHRALLAHPCSQVILADLWMGGLRTRKNTNLKVILGLVFPPYIFRLEFKTVEELQLMPQTQEEHLENDDDDDSSEPDKSPDAENGRKRSLVITSPIHHFSVQNKKGRKCSLIKTTAIHQLSLHSKTLLSDNFIRRDTIVQENGRVFPDLEETKYSFTFEEKSLQKKRTRPLKLKKKVYEFFTAPITKFWANSISYLIFLIIYSYMVLVRMDQTPRWQEYVVISYICSFGCEKIREIISSEPVAVRHKLAVWASNMWNLCDASAITFFFIGLGFRLKPYTMEVGRVMYCVDSIYWYLRILNILGVNKYLGPLVTMMGKMVKNMIYFVVLLLVVLMSFGVSRQSILYPNKEASWRIVRDVFFEPYFMLYGEVFADRIDPPCGGEGEEECLTGRWINPAVMSIYLVIANILLINLLIAVFNNIFIEVNAVSHQVWMFQRFTVVMEYEQKPILPPPVILICHMYLLFKYFKRKRKGLRETYDNGLKLFLEPKAMNMLYKFEEECVEGYFSEQEKKQSQSMEYRIKVVIERMEYLAQKVEDIDTKVNTQGTLLQNIEFRSRKIGEAFNELAEMMHRFLAAKRMSDDKQTLAPDRTGDRLRRSSERSDAPSDDSHGLLQPLRKRPTRSLTEVRPDAYIFDDGAHYEVRTVAEESDEHLESMSAAGSRKEIHMMEQIERQRSSDSKTSVDSDRGDTEEDEYKVSQETLTLESLKFRYAQRRRDSFGGRRNSEGGYGEEAFSGSRPSLTRRQLSETQSEPDSSEPMVMGGGSNSLQLRAIVQERNVAFAEPKINVIPPSSSSSGCMCGIGTSSAGPAVVAASVSSAAPAGNSAGGGVSNGNAQPHNPRSMLMSMHTEYTSITDELESVCGLLSPPRTPRLLSPPRPGQSAPVHNRHRRRCASEMSNPEFALFMEKQHLRSAEEYDYMLMEDLIQRKYDEDEDEPVEQNPALLTVVQESREFRNSYPGRSLRRASAIEDDTMLPIVCVNPRQESEESSENMPLVQPLPPRPTIVVDSSQLPIHEEVVKKADSKASLHMQSETMC